MRRRLFFRHTLMLLVSLPVVLTLMDMRYPALARAGQNEPEAQAAGALTAFDENGHPLSPCPLKHTDVKAEISGFLARVVVTQEFENPFTDKIEAVYTFPLPAAAAVDDMTMLIGDRVIRGRIMRREEATATYEAAKASGRMASLLNQERPNVFTQSVANIMPGQPVKVTISYVETLKYEAGQYEFTFPMVIGERYMPDSMDDSQSKNITPPVVPAGMRAGHDISIEVKLDAGVPVGTLDSASHAIDISRSDERRAIVRLREQSVIPNKDFVLKYAVAGSRIEDALLAHRSSKGGFFTLILQPPERVTVEDVTPKELVFVLDTSGSMSGFPFERARETVKLALDNLYPQDTFNLITFSGDEHVLFPQPVSATPDNLKKAKKFLDGRESGGGTEMMKAIRAALDPSDAQDHVRIACFMTDGQVGNDMEIIAEVQKHPNARVFAMGFGSAPNRFLLDRMTTEGRGEVEYVTVTDKDAKAVARRFHERVRNPLLTDIKIDWGGLPVADVYPQRIPDLFSAQPVILSGRYTAGGRGTIRLQGKMSGRGFVREIQVELPDATKSHEVLATLWARRRIDDLMGQDYAGLQTGTPRKEVSEEITQLGLDYRLMTQFTSFVAVEENPSTDTSAPRRVDVPMENTVDTNLSYLGGANVSVTASSSGAQMNATATCVSTVVSRNALAELPINGRKMQSLASLSPGSATTAGAPLGSVAAGQISVNGQRPASNSYFIDGLSADIGLAPVEQSFGPTAAGASPELAVPGGTSSLTSSEAVAEVQIATYNNEAEYGRSSGARISVTTKAGTNEFHGSLFEYFGHDAFDASDWFANSMSLRQPPRRQNNYGGTLGGPIKRDRAFFFLTYEGWRLRQPLVGLTDVPTLPARVAAPAVLRPLLNAYPLPNGAARPDGFAPFAASYANPGRLDAINLRVDDQINDTLYLSGRYSFATAEADERGAGIFSLNTRSNLRSTTQTLSASADYSLSPSVVTNVKANYSRFTLRSSSRLDEFGGAVIPTPAELFSSIFANSSAASLLNLNGRNAALTNSDEVAATQRQFNVLGSVNIISGTHTLKFGADYRRLSPIPGVQPFEQSALFNGVAQALTGTASRLSRYTRTGPQRPLFKNFSLYGQDAWRITPRLTLTYGLRWEVNPSPTMSDGREEALAVTGINDLSQLRLAPQGTRLWRTTYNNFAPRAGLVYEAVSSSGRQLVVRGSFGVLYDTGQEQSGVAFTDSFPFVSGQSAFDVSLPLSTNATATSRAGPQASVPFVAFDPHLKLPYTLRWNLEVEQALGARQSVNVAYVGTAGRRLLLAQTFLEPNPDFAFVRLNTNGASSDYHALQLRYLRNLSNRWQALVAYTWGKSLDNASQDSIARTLLRSVDTADERGPSDFDVRHTLTGMASYDVPSPFTHGLGETLLRNWTFESLFNLRSALPVNVVYSVPTVYGFAYLRPDLNAGVPLYLSDPNAGGGRRINPAAFIIPDGDRQGSLGRNSLRGFPFYQFDFGLRRRFNFNERVSLQFKAEALNIFNHPNFADPVGTDTSLGGRLSATEPFVANATFGRSASQYGRSLWEMTGRNFGSSYTGGPRTVQFSLKLQF